MKTTEKNKYIIGSICIVVLAAFCIAAFWQGLTVRVYDQTTDKIVSPIRIAVLTDLHDTTYGKSQKNLIAAIQNQNPDLILLVGDIADDKKLHDATEQLLSVIGTVYPCFYVSGNHEFWSGEADVIKKMIRSYGVTVLEGDTFIVPIGDQKVRICGVDDPDGFDSRYRTNHTKGDSLQEQLHACKAEIGDDTYSILLSHRPELTEVYRNSGFNLVVTGHSHGGQIRIPGILNGLYAPNQGFFPKYAGGRYELNETVMIVSRGLSKARIPRVFNPPELVMVNLIPSN